jgi:hypothetical protein
MKAATGHAACLPGPRPSREAEEYAAEKVGLCLRPRARGAQRTTIRQPPTQGGSGRGRGGRRTRRPEAWNLPPATCSGGRAVGVGDCPVRAPVARASDQAMNCSLHEDRGGRHGCELASRQPGKLQPACIRQPAAAVWGRYAAAADQEGVGSLIWLACARTQLSCVRVAVMSTVVDLRCGLLMSQTSCTSTVPALVPPRGGSSRMGCWLR